MDAEEPTGKDCGLPQGHKKLIVVSWLTGICNEESKRKEDR